MYIFTDEQMNYLKKHGHNNPITLVHNNGKKRTFYHVLNNIDIKDNCKKWVESNNLGEHIVFKKGELSLFPSYTGSNNSDSDSDSDDDIFDSSNIKHTGSTQRDLLYVAGRSGCGKSTTMSKYSLEYKKVNPKNRVIMITATNPLIEDGLAAKNFKKVDTLVFDVSKPEIVQNNFMSGDNNLNLDLISDSLLIVDDVEALINKSYKKAIMDFVNQVLMQGRHFRISVCISRHLAAGGQETITTLNESRWVVIFPSAGGNLNYFMKTHCDIREDCDKRYIKNANSRYVFIHKCSPPFMFGEKFIKCISDGY